GGDRRPGPGERLAAVGPHAPPRLDEEASKLRKTLPSRVFGRGRDSPQVAPGTSHNPLGPHCRDRRIVPGTGPDRIERDSVHPLERGASRWVFASTTTSRL